MITTTIIIIIIVLGSMIYFTVIVTVAILIIIITLLRLRRRRGGCDQRHAPRGRMPECRTQAMKSEPPTPTRATDNQFRKMLY